MSIMPRRLRPGQQVTVHMGIENRGRKPINPLLRITVIDPVGRPIVLLEQHALIFPTCTSAATTYADRKRQRANFYVTYTTSPDAPLGCYRVKLENFVDGNLLYSETLENDFFYVEQLELVAVEPKVESICARIRNLSPETVPAILYQPSSPDATTFRSVVHKFAGATETSISLASKPAFLQYANQTTLALTHPEEPVALRNQQFFWRKEDADVVFVLDPRCGHKRDFFLSGEARKLWEAASGLHPRSDLRIAANAHLYDVMIAKELLKEH